MFDQMKYYILSDLEGVSGIEKFENTRTRENGPKLKGMKQLAREINACAEGIKHIDSEAIIDVLDGHGPGGLLADDLVGCNYMRLDSGVEHIDFTEYDALLFVGQHAMAGTVNAPLCHTYSSINIQYYQLNGIFIGEFASRALVAGLQGVPTIFLAGDDKAAIEAVNFIPEIETVITKWGTGLESARHIDSDEVCQLIREGAKKAVQRLNEIPPYTAIQPPFVFEARYYESQDFSKWKHKPYLTWIDDRTYRIESNDILRMPF